MTCINCNLVSYGCTECTDSNTCTSCDFTLNVDISGSTCKCLDPYVAPGNNLPCQLCNATLSNCISCIDTLTCTSCN
jgi:hypothetical protein